MFTYKLPNEITKIAIKQVEEAISLSGISACITGDGSMFRVHFNDTIPTTYRETYQEKEIKIIINELLDYLFLKNTLFLHHTKNLIYLFPYILIYREQF